MITGKMRIGTAAGLIFLAGCGGDGSSQGPVAGLPANVVTPAAQEKHAVVAFPEYVNWSQFPVGTSVVRKKVVTNGSETLQTTTTLRLLEKTAEKVVVESQITVERPGQPVQQNPAVTQSYPSTFLLPANMRAEQFSLPSLKAESVGKETRRVGNQSYEAELFSWKEVNEAGPMAVKLWRSDQIPGRLLRQEIKGRNHDSVEEIVEIILPAAVAEPAK